MAGIAAALTHKELADLFGDTLPIEAVNLIFSSPDGMTMGEIRDKLREMAPGWRRKAAIHKVVLDYFRALEGETMMRVRTSPEHADYLTPLIEDAVGAPTVHEMPAAAIEAANLVRQIRRIGYNRKQGAQGHLSIVDEFARIEEFAISALNLLGAPQ